MHFERNSVHFAVDVPGVPKQYAPYVFPQERESQLQVTDQETIAAQWEACGLRLQSSRTDGRSGIARSCLVLRKSAMRNVSAAEESFRQWNCVGRVRARGNVEGENCAERNLARKNHIS